jgi:alkanesulfonate monooxygenase SsuD/methylene tetrahydromethanopterin reductase-like flavin-dependent oxidoreductase (luciferase family)
MTSQFIAAMSAADYQADGLNGPNGEKLASSVAACAQAGFDGLSFSHMPGVFEPLELAAYVAGEANVTSQIYVAQRVGLIAPTMCSRMFATLDQLLGGRLVAVLETNTTQAAADGDVDSGHMIERAHEYGRIMRDLWAADAPIDHAGSYYKFNKGRTNVSTVKRGQTPIYLSCASVEGVEKNSAFKGVVLPRAGLQVTAAAIAKFRAQDLHVAVNIDAATDNLDVAIRLYAQSGAQVFIVNVPDGHVAYASRYPRFLESWRMAAQV